MTDLVHGLKAQDKQLTEDQIAYILHETLQVIFFHSFSIMTPFLIK